MINPISWRIPPKKDKNNKRLNRNFILERDINSSTQTEISKDINEINIVEEQEKLKKIIEIQTLLLEMLNNNTGGDK